MTEIKEPIFQSVLREQYNITDPLFAEGRFVGLIGDHAANIVCLGLSMSCLMVARIVLSGDNMDYDLISIMPLPLLSMSYECSSKKVKIKSQFKAIQVFQLCSTDNQAEVWGNFTSFIRDIHPQLNRGVWVATTLRPVPKPYKMPFPEVDYTHIFIRPKCPKYTQSTMSLPARLPLQEQECHHDMLLKYHSVDVLNVEFDSFVNDAHTTLVNGNDKKLSNNNRNAPSDSPVKVDTVTEADNKIMKLFRRILPCLKAQK